MPPIYQYECQNCNKDLEVVRSMSESDVPPDETSSDSCELHAWVKVIKFAPKKAYAPGWGSDRKGRYGSDW